MPSKNAKRILSVRIIRQVDTDPDTSYLGEYSNRATSEFSIDRKHDTECPTNLGKGKCTGCIGDMGRNEYQYFNPSQNYSDCTPEEIRKYVRQDYDRMESLNAGNWCYIGIRAQAEVQVPSDVVQRIGSGGLWGIESDSDKSYFAEVEADELAQLRAELKSIGFSTRAISTAFRNIEHEDE